ncbi:MAG: leucine-rich repeat protein [Alistipes sp.]|nr:leucine-rich repeat protein [Alistipes sp.]
MPECDTRTYVEDNKYLRWNAGDEITIFNGNSYNSHWQFAGENGANSGKFTEVEENGFVTGTPLNLTANYAIYPYDENITITESGVVSLTLPATQAYNHTYANSFGAGANTMMAVTESTSDNFLAFKNLCGYLKLKFYGDDVTVKNVTIKGNNSEKIAGNATVTMTYGGEPTITMGNGATDTITIDCGEGVTLSNDSTNPTIFWVVIPETTFEGGITITVTDTNDQPFTKTTTNAVPITNNMIQPMATLEVECATVGPANNEIWYTTTDGAYGGVSIYSKGTLNILSNIYDTEKGWWIITTADDITYIPEHMFEQKYTLTNVLLPQSVTLIENNAFYMCQKLENINIPDNVGVIKHGAFSNCKSLKSIILPKGVEIDRSVFYMCYGLENVINLDKASMINSTAFFECTSLSTVEINATFIGSQAFRNCTNITTIVLGENFETFHDYGGAFYGCNNVAEIFCKASVPPSICVYANGADCDFPYKYKTIPYVIYVPRDAYEDYLQYSSIKATYAAQQNWSYYEDIIQPYDF